MGAGSIVIEAPSHDVECLLNALVDWISTYSPTVRPLRVAIAGDGALGKSTITKMLADRIGAPRLEADGYGLDRKARSKRGILHLEDRRSFDRRRFLRDMHRVCLGGDIRRRVYDHCTGKIVSRGKIGLGDAKVVLLDGSCLLEPSLSSTWDLAVLIDARSSLRRSMRIGADQSRGYAKSAALANWQHHKHFYAKRIASWRARAAVIVTLQAKWRYAWDLSALRCTCKNHRRHHYATQSEQVA